MRRGFKNFKCDARKLTGILLMLVGVVILLVCIPKWVWSAVVGILFILIGFLMWRF